MGLYYALCLIALYKLLFSSYNYTVESFLLCVCEYGCLPHILILNGCVIFCCIKVSEIINQSPIPGHLGCFHLFIVILKNNLKMWWLSLDRYMSVLFLLILLYKFIGVELMFQRIRISYWLLTHIAKKKRIGLLSQAVHVKAYFLTISPVLSVSQLKIFDNMIAKNAKKQFSHCCLILNTFH